MVEFANMRSRVATMDRMAIAVLLAFVWIINQGIAAQGGSTVYDPNPGHLWNRLNEALFARTAPDGRQYGLNELDILYWYQTTNLLAGTSYQRGLSVLDEFINSHGEKMIQDPFKKALLQRDLWALFDWSAMGNDWNHKREREMLQKRLAVAIKRLALATNEIPALPDNYALAGARHMSDLPQGLFQSNSDWICVGVNSAEMTVPAHVRGFGSRSAFTVWFHDADGRKAGLDYLSRLRSFTPMFLYVTNRDSRVEPELNPELPEFPPNSQWALVRRMCVINDNGRIQPTHVTESIQLRTYRAIAPPGMIMVTNRNGFVFPEPVPPQCFNEFQMSRDSQGGLVSIASNGRAFTSNNRFFSMGIDPFQGHLEPQTNQIHYRAIVLRTCMECHTAKGIYSVNSFTRFLSGGPSFQTTQMVEVDPDTQALATVNGKLQQFDWGLLEGIWNNGN